MNRHALGLILVTLAAIGWSVSGVMVKNLPHVGDMALTGWRSIFTTLVFWVALSWAAGGTGAAGRALFRALATRVVWAQGLSYAVMLVCFIKATVMTTAANAILLQYTAPLWVALLSWPLLGERVRPREWVTLAGCLVGMVCFFAEKLSASGFWGNVVAVVSGVACGLNMLFIRMMSRVEAPATPDATPPSSGAARTTSEGMTRALPAVILGNILAVAACAPWMGVATEWNSFTWGMIALMGIVQLGIPYVLFMLGMSMVSAVEGVLFAMLEAILNPIWTALGAGEVPSRAALIGGALILASVTVYGVSRARAESRETTAHAHSAGTPT